MIGLAPTPLSGRASKTRMASITSHAELVVITGFEPALFTISK
jgi:hypothetical protein